MNSGGIGTKSCKLAFFYQNTWHACPVTKLQAGIFDHTPAPPPPHTHNWPIPHVHTISPTWTNRRPRSRFPLQGMVGPDWRVGAWTFFSILAGVIAVLHLLPGTGAAVCLFVCVCVLSVIVFYYDYYYFLFWFSPPTFSGACPIIFYRFKSSSSVMWYH